MESGTTAASKWPIAWIRSTPLEGLEDSGAKAIYRHRYTIDLARGLVIFEEPIVANGHVSATGGSGYEVVLDPAQPVLRATCSVRDATTLEPARYEHERSTGGSGGTMPRYVRHDELTLTNLPQYGAAFAIDAVDTNSTELDTQADEILDAVQLEYQTTTPETAVFPGFQLIDLDGAIQQLGLQIGNSGATTTIRAATRSRGSGAGTLLPGKCSASVPATPPAVVLAHASWRRPCEPIRAPRRDSRNEPIQYTRQRAAKGAVSKRSWRVDPPLAVMSIVGSTTEDGVAFVRCVQPSAAFGTQYAVNGPVRVPAGEKGVCYRRGEVPVAYVPGAIAGTMLGPRTGAVDLLAWQPGLDDRRCRRCR